MIFRDELQLIAVNNTVQKMQNLITFLLCAIELSINDLRVDSFD